MHRFLSAAFAAAVCLMAADSAVAQMGFGNQVVGGIAIDAAGMVPNPDPQASEKLAAERTLLLADAVSAEILPELAQMYADKGVELRGCAKTLSLLDPSRFDIFAALRRKIVGGQTKNRTWNTGIFNTKI